MDQVDTLETVAEILYDEVGAGPLSVVFLCSRQRFERSFIMLIFGIVFLGRCFKQIFTDANFIYNLFVKIRSTVFHF